MLAVGLLDGPQLLRVAIDPHWCEDEEVARQITEDLNDPERGVLDPGEATIEARGADRLTQMLSEQGWQDDEPWTPLNLDLSAPLDDTGLRVEVIDHERAGDWMAVHWSAFRGTALTNADRREVTNWWRTMATGPLYADARSLMLSDGHGSPVAVAAVWSAGPGRPGLVEPMGVHQDHHGQGHGRAITRAAAAALRDLGSSSAIVCAESANLAAVATYTSAGFTAHPQVADLCRTG